MAFIEVTSRDINGDRADAQKKADKLVVKRGGKKRGRPPRPSRAHLWEGQEWRPHSQPYDKGDLKERASGDMGHSMWRTGAWTWCHRCGLHSRHKVLGLKRQCKGVFVNTQARVRRDRLRSGLHQYHSEALGVNALPLRRLVGKQAG